MNTGKMIFQCITVCGDQFLSLFKRRFKLTSTAMFHFFIAVARQPNCCIEEVYEPMQTVSRILFLFVTYTFVDLYYKIKI